jgi:hypothetical protein
MRTITWKVLPIFLVLGGGLSLTVQHVGAQSIVERMRRAAEEAQRRKQQQPPPQPAPAPAPPPAGAAPATKGVANQPVSASDLLAQPSAAAVVDPQMMPDILGVHIGMPAREAEVATRNQYAKGAFRAYSYPLPPIPQPLVLGFTMNVDAVGVQGNDKAAVDVTPPPNPQVVWRVSRETNMLHVNRATLLASLREKYGKESIAFVGNGNLDSPTTNDNQIGLLYWLIDEHGKHVAAPPNPRVAMANCSWKAPQGAPMDNELFHGERTLDPVFQDAWAASSCIGTIVNIQPFNDPQIIELMYATVQDVPLYLRSAAATGTWWKAAANKSRQDDLERSKQNRPKL